MRSTYKVRRNDEGEAQRRKWTFYKAIKCNSCPNLSQGSFLGIPIGFTRQALIIIGSIFIRQDAVLFVMRKESIPSPYPISH